ncbi:N-glycosidase R617 [Colletotrichum spaethianum]|uniref:N-glycosidase R617 n=1 Tax=Colletotrichum spaethianum TaxID=700344 RepID=A0AA37L9Q0_9PEZI|nr:N-glycosidase R617 [Colletotrichum spaethianum]GKT40362.1 N-glycosidase R617 [Colletotrichum spaethianum]
MDISPIFFWRETGQEGYLSQWWTKDPFTSPSSPASPPITFKTAEHYMMHDKALLFSDADVALSVLKADHPRKVKTLGRKVKGFDEALWNANRERIVREGNLLKFRCAPELKEKLLATGERELVEASPLDRIWGIGFSPEKAPASDRSCWGLNLLGKVLMEVRTTLRKEQEREREIEDEKDKSKARRRRVQLQDEAEQNEEGTFKTRRVGDGKD